MILPKLIRGPARARALLKASRRRCTIAQSFTDPFTRELVLACSCGASTRVSGYTMEVGRTDHLGKWGSQHEPLPSVKPPPESSSKALRRLRHRRAMPCTT